MKVLSQIVKIFPFAGIIGLNIYSQVVDFQVDQVRVPAIILLVLLVIGLVIKQVIKLEDYFMVGMSLVTIVSISIMLVSETFAEFYVELIVTGLYLGLFLAAAVPPLVRMTPFTVLHSRGDYPEAVLKTEKFIKINLIINHIWTFAFFVAIGLSLITYSNNYVANIVLHATVPMAVMMLIGMPATKILPGKLMQSTPNTGRIQFDSVAEMFKTMPYGVNPRRAEGVDITIQFNMSGKEEITGYLQVKDQICTFTEGTHPNPTTEVTSDSEVWLGITNGTINGEEALLAGRYQMTGDVNIMNRLHSLFQDDDEPAPKKKTKKKEEVFTYGKLPANSIKNILVIEGGARGEKISKSTYAAMRFVDGAKAAGANIETINLYKKEIKPCIGCYHCWTTKPGVCCHKDDMPELMMKYRKADLVVFISPLFIFSVTGTMKSFMDRLLPIMKPFMISNEDDNTLHPDRYPEFGKQGFVVFSAAGFPEVDHNFDGLRKIYQSWDSHNENASLLGEFLIPAAELLTMPPYRDRKKLIEDSCYAAGQQVVKEGYIDQGFMDDMQRTDVTKSSFRDRANNFWGSLIDKTYMREYPRLKKPE